VGFGFGETDKLGFAEGNFVREKGEQGLGGAVFEAGDDFWHGIEHADGHGPRHGGDGDLDDFHGVVLGVMDESECVFGLYGVEGFP
jgi:hypothetical protein